MARYTAALWASNGRGGRDRLGLNIHPTTTLAECEEAVKRHLQTDEVPNTVEIVRWNDAFTESEIDRAATCWPFPPGEDA